MNLVPLRGELIEADLPLWGDPRRYLPRRLFHLRLSGGQDSKAYLPCEEGSDGGTDHSRYDRQGICRHRRRSDASRLVHR